MATSGNRPVTHELQVHRTVRAKHCARCRRGPLQLLRMEGAVPLCLDGADLGHLRYLPRGDAALTRRAREESTLWAVVVRFNRRKARHERQGLLVEPAALMRAEELCRADADVRALRRARDAVRRRAEDARFTDAFTEVILCLFPGCPPARARAVAEHTAARGSGRIGRTAAGRALEERAVTSAVIAAVRHLDTPYDGLLMSGVPRNEARRRIAPTVDALLQRWRAGATASSSGTAGEQRPNRARGAEVGTAPTPRRPTTTAADTGTPARSTGQ